MIDQPTDQPKFTPDPIEPKPIQRRWSKSCSWISLVVLMCFWFVGVTWVIADVLTAGAKTAASVGQQVAWSIVSLVVLAMLLRKRLGLTVSRGRVLGVLIFSLLWPYFLQGFEQGGAGATRGTIQAEVVLSLVALVIVALVIGEVIRLPRLPKGWVVRWPDPNDPKEWLKRQDQCPRYMSFYGCPNSIGWDMDRHNRLKWSLGQRHDSIEG